MNALLLVAGALAGPRGLERGVARPEGLEAAYGSRHVALVVGIDTYADPALPDLHFASQDAADMTAVLSDASIGRYDVVSSLTGEVTAAGFWSAFEALAGTVHRDDTVVIYVAAHGTLDLGPAGSELYLMPSDGWLDTATDSGIRVAQLVAAVEALPARRRVVILDSCYSGTGRSQLAPDTRIKLDRIRGPVPAPAALMVSAFSANLYAAHIHQPALEDPGLANGVYTHFLVEGLRGAADANGDGLIEVMEAHDFARDKTLGFTGGSQVPWAETVVVGRQAVYLAGDPELRSSAELGELRGLEALPGGAVLTVDGVPRGAGAVRPGPHAVSVVEGDQSLWVDTVRVRPGQTLDVGREVAARASHVQVASGPVVSSDASWLGTLGGMAFAAYVPRDPGGLRWSFGARVRLAAGPADVRAGSGGAVAVEGGPAWQVGAVQVGPRLAGGWVWRVGPEALQGAPMLEPGVGVALGRGSWIGRVDLAGSGFPADGGLAVSPWLAAGLGFRL